MSIILLSPLFALPALTCILTKFLQNWIFLIPVFSRAYRLCARGQRGWERRQKDIYNDALVLGRNGRQGWVVEVVISPLINNFVLCCFFVPVTMTQVTPPPPPCYHPRLHWGKWNGLIERSYGVSWLLWRLSTQSPSPSRLRAWEDGLTDHPTPTIPPLGDSQSSKGYRTLFLRKISDFNKKVFIPKF